MSEDAGSIITVDGQLAPDELGITLPHEHLFADFTHRFDPPNETYKRKLSKQPVTIDLLWYLESHSNTKHRDNLLLDSFDEAVEEVSRYYRRGGDSLVEVTPKNVGSDPQQVRAVARETGLNIIQGTAYYTHRDSEHPERLYSATIDEIAEEFISDVTEGINNTGIRAGLIGEIGLSERIHEQEEKVLRAGARAAARTGAPLMVHPPGFTKHSQRDRTYPSSRWGLEILDIVEEEGLDPTDQVVLCHMDRSRWYEDLSYQEEIAERGAFIEYDLFGHGQVLYNEEQEDAFPDDVERVEYLAELIDAGYGSNLLISHDIFLKQQRITYGGLGYTHLLDNVPAMFHGQDLEDDNIEQLMSENPRRLLTFEEST